MLRGWVSPSTCFALAVGNPADMGITASFATAAFCRIEPDADALAISCLLGLTFLKLRQVLIGRSTIRLGLRFHFGFRSRLR